MNNREYKLIKIITWAQKHKKKMLELTPEDLKKAIRSKL